LCGAKIFSNSGEGRRKRFFHWGGLDHEERGLKRKKVSRKWMKRAEGKEAKVVFPKGKKKPT